ncbi:MAG: plasma-membrane proton-efflux P-type ATPase [Dehalococcoidales bacterium]|nr:plasma-membrane proton-efflux P-type ATPase [Dehalococcoidales bacterium]
MSVNGTGQAEAQGLTAAEAAKRLQQYGPNEVPERRENPWLSFLRKFWAPVPWMLEAAIVLTLVLGRQADAVIIFFLLVFNAVLSFVQESRAENALALLRQHLAINTRVRRDGEWQLLPARELVPGDVIHVRVGDIVPADVRVLDGDVQLDQSALTGESLPVEASRQGAMYSGSIVQRGEATAEVVATGGKTYFGKTTQLVQSAKTVTHLETIIFNIVKYLLVIDVLLVAALLIYVPLVGISLLAALPFALILLVASVPVALPATFTIAQALGSLELSRRGVLVTRLSAIEEAASMDALCVDKTGTITLNELSVGAVRAYPPFAPDQPLEFAALASDAASQDAIDLAILRASATPTSVAPYRRLSFTPFDPATKRTEAVVEQDGTRLRVMKGLPQVLTSLSAAVPPELTSDVASLSAQGYRVLAVAAGSDGSLRLAGLIALVDRPRPDSAALVSTLRDLGVRIRMITGDAAPTALAIARQVGMDGQACGPQEIKGQHDGRCTVFAGVLPQDKYDLVRALQSAGHVVGMTGDGVNDAPALKQAEVGVAVAGATDVAKAAASMVLTDPGLLNLVSAVKTSRQIYQRMLTYTLNKIIKTIQVALFLTLAFFVTKEFVITPFLVVLLLFANDFVTMAIATDNVGYSDKPDRWQVPALVATSGLLAMLVLAESFLVLYLAEGVFHLALPQLQTLIFVMLVFSGQATVYLVRQRRHLWQSRPSRWLIMATIGDLIVVSLLATQGLLMTAVGWQAVLAVLGIAVAFMFLMDPIKVIIFERFGLA